MGDIDWEQIDLETEAAEARLSELTAPKGAKVSGETTAKDRREWVKRADDAGRAVRDLNRALAKLESSEARLRAAVLAEKEACAEAVRQMAVGSEHLAESASADGRDEQHHRSDAFILRAAVTAIRSRHPKTEEQR